jgi:hypothetical protein
MGARTDVVRSYKVPGFTVLFVRAQGFFHLIDKTAEVKYYGYIPYF